MKKCFCILLSLVMIMSLSATAFAAEPKDNSNNDVKVTKYDVELGSEGIVSVSDENGNIMPTSSISGYANADVTSNASSFRVNVSASGIGGMGVTVKTSCANWNGTITFSLISNTNSKPINQERIPTNDETYFNGLVQGLPSSPAYYIALFEGIPSGYTIHVDIWIYG